jgi:hypothetical protein
VSATAAAITLAWAAIVVLALALGAVTGQLRQLQAVLATSRAGERQADRLVSSELGPAAGDDIAVALLVDPTCEVCETVRPLFEREASRRDGSTFRILSTEPVRGPGDVPVLVDADLVRLVDPGWRPALVVVDADGAVLARDAVGTEKTLLQALDRTGEPRIVRGER